MKYNLYFAFIFILALIFRFLIIKEHSVPFAYDMGRDLLWAKDISFYHIPTLIGPAGSIWGVYFGPLWFYILSVPLLLTNGNPLSAVYTTAIIVTLTGVLAFFLFKKLFQPENSLIFAILVLFNQSLIGASTFAFHANMLPLLTMLFIFCCFISITKNIEAISLALFFASLMFHADPAPAVVFSAIVPIIYFYFKLYKKGKIIKVISLSALAYSLPFIPQIIFEFRNNFIQLRSLIAYFEGKNPSLSGQLPLFARVINRIDIFFNQFTSGFSGGNKYLALLLILFIVVGIYRYLRKNADSKSQRLLKLILLIILGVYFIFTFLVTVEVKSWYLVGMPVLYSFLILFAILGFKKYKALYLVFIVAFVFINAATYFKTEASSKRDPVLLSNQLQAVNLIYNDQNGLDYSVYTYTPTIYDLSYQYLFWWKGIAQAKGLPRDFAYLPNKPSYVRNKSNYAKERGSSNTIYLVIENTPGNQLYNSANWLTNFNNYEIIWEKNISDAIEVQKRQLTKKDN